MTSLVTEAEAFLGGKSQAVKAELARQMEEAADAPRFRAAPPASATASRP